MYLCFVFEKDYCNFDKKLKQIMAKEKDSMSASGVIYNSLTHGSKIIGKIIADKDFRIDGEIEGDIICKGKVVIGKQGYLKGTIQCAYAEILGKIEGVIDVSDTLSLRENSLVIGEVKTKILVVEPKALFQGTCSMLKDKDIKLENNAAETPTDGAKKIKQVVF